MVKLSGYTEVSYTELQRILKSVLTDTEITKIQIAEKLGVSNLVTVYNAFNVDLQMVSDERLSKLLSILKVPALIVYGESEKKYFISSGYKYFKKSKSKAHAGL